MAHNSLTRFILVAGSVFALNPLSLAIAQESTEGKNIQNALLEEIVVTARKRDENLLDIPVAVSAITGSDLENRGVVAMKDLADNAPGLVVSDNFSGKTDRTVQSFSLRGFFPSSGVENTVSTFIDGVAVSSTTAMSSVGSPERVEILRGPQAAYFGRNTFAGAVNVINKQPGHEWAGSVSTTLGNYDYFRLRGEVEGPLIEDKLAFRASAEMYEKEGPWKNSYDGGTLGDQETKMANLYVLATPTDNLTIKAFGFMSQDDDGPSASAFLSAYDITDFFGNVMVQGQANCVINSNPYFCGSYPKKIDKLSYNTKADASMKALLDNPKNRLTDTDMLDDYGMAREFTHGHVVVDYDFGDSGFTLSSLTGVNNEEWILLNDIDHYGSDSFNYGFLVENKKEDFSQEFRLNYDNGGRFRGVVGVNYLDASSKSANASGLTFGTPVSATEITYSGESVATTKGLFFGSSYDVTDKLKLSVEGRYQEDEISSLDPSGNEILSETFTNFLPRLIADYKLTDELMAYASYSKGVNPAGFNLGLLVQSEYLQDLATDAGITLTVDPEEVENFEIGLKGTALDGRLNFAAAAYYAEWTKQINRINLVVVEPGEATATSFSGIANTGAVDLYGLEFEGNWAATDNILVNLTAAYTGTEIDKFQNTLLTSLTGMSDFSGKEQPGVAKYSGNLGVQYSNAFGSGAQEYPWFARIDYIYKSGQYSNAANLIKTEDVHRVNLRAGVSIGDFSIQTYVDNVFDYDEYTTAYDYFAFTPTFAYFGDHSGTVLSMSQPRTYGVKLKMDF